MMLVSPHLMRAYRLYRLLRFKPDTVKALVRRECYSTDARNRFVTGLGTRVLGIRRTVN